MSHPPAESTTSRVRVLYVAGTGRSGSTLMSNLLGSSAGMVSLGELRYLWERGLGESGPCGCGALVAECEFWRGVLDRAYPDGAVDTDAVKKADAHLLRLRRLVALRKIGRGERSDATADWYTAELSKVYRAIHEQTGGAVIVDSSNLPGFGYLLNRAEGVEVTVLHLVRDPRGVAYSWGRRRTRYDRGSGDVAMGREGALKSSVLWDVWNWTTEKLWRRRNNRYVRVRYEDAIADPHRALEPVMRLVGLRGEDLPAPVDGEFDMPVSHTVAGNPARTATGKIRLAADDEWVSSMSAVRRIAVTTVTAPLLRRYGYPIRATRQHGASLDGKRVFVEDLHGLPRLSARVRRNVSWVRDEGLARVLEEKEIAPVRNARAAAAKRSYRASGATSPGDAVGVFVVGVQRSGTNMLVRGLGAAPETEVHNENDSAAFERFKLRPNSVIDSIVAASRHSHVLFKPLCDSHRTDQLLDELTAARRPLAVWTYRDVDGRVRSALAKFGDGNRQVLREFANGTNVDRWHVQRMSNATADLVRSFSYDSMSAASGAALMWLVRNQLYFDLALDTRDDVHLTSYNALLADPEATMTNLCRFLGFPYRPTLAAHVVPRVSPYREPLDIDPRIRDLCDALAQRLAVAARRTSDASAA